MIERIQANAEITIRLMRPLSGIDFGYTRESVEWLQGYIERMRQSGQFDAPTARDRCVSVFGSFLGECLVRCHGGVWKQHEGTWCVAFGDDNFAFPFQKVWKQMENGLGDGIGGFFQTIPLIMSGHMPLPPPQPDKPR
jgi:hypothetical protein